MSLDEQVIAAESEINRVLRELEEKTGWVVLCIDLNDTDISTISSPDMQVLRSVRIQMQHPPRHRWAS